MISGKRKTIGVFLCKAYSFFDNAVYHALEDSAKKHDVDIVVFTTVGFFSSGNDYDTQERGMFGFAPIEKLDGILVAPDTYEIEGFRDQMMAELTARARCPVISIRHQGGEFDCVYTDDEYAFRPLMKHLLEDHELKRIRFLAGYEGHPDSERRLQVYREEMASHGIEIDEERDIRHGNMWLTSGKIAYEAFFEGQEEYPEAVVCANDYMAVGLMRTLRAKGIHVPEDVIVTGFDNVSNITPAEPTLTTVEQDFAGMTVAAMDELVRQIRDGITEDEKKEKKGIPIGGRLIIGESCGCGCRGKDYFENISTEFHRQMDSMTSREVSMTYLTIELNACDDLKDLHRVLVNKMADTPMVRDYYLCLFEKGRDENDDPVFAEEITDNACLVHAMRNRKDHGMPMISFDRRELLPEMAERKDEPQMFFLMLLHQREDAYGYAMFHYEPGEVPSNFFQHWNVVLSGALSNMHKRDELRLLYEERRLSSITDVLTRLLNRRGLEEQLTPVWQRMCAGRENVAFVSFDMDWLKQINDTYGHQAGDYAIRLTGSAIRRAAPKDAILARVGGDEFLAVLPRADLQAAKQFMKGFQTELEMLNELENRSFNVEASCGAVVFRLNSFSTIEECVHKSDEEMYRKKEKRHSSRMQ